MKRLYLPVCFDSAQCGCADVVAQNSINAYWQQTYHENSPLEPLSEYAWWRIGADWQQKAYDFRRPEASLEAEDALVSEDSGIETTRPSENTEEH